MCQSNPPERLMHNWGTPCDKVVIGWRIEVYRLGVGLLLLTSSQPPLATSLLHLAHPRAAGRLVAATIYPVSSNGLHLALSLTKTLIVTLATDQFLPFESLQAHLLDIIHSYYQIGQLSTSLRIWAHTIIFQDSACGQTRLPSITSLSLRRVVQLANVTENGYKAN